MVYAKGTMGKRTTLHHQEKLILAAYCDADYAANPEENDLPMHSLTGIIIDLKGIGQIYVYSGLQKTLSRSSCESEYRAAGMCVQFISAYRNQLEELGFPPKEKPQLRSEKTTRPVSSCQRMSFVVCRQDISSLIIITRDRQWRARSCAAVSS
jgi:hypothetical protein